MPTNLPVNRNIIPKTAKLTVLLLFFPLIFSGQKLTGLWTGTPANDSNTIRKDQSFEIALTEYRGKVFGYSRSEFIINDTLYYIVKRVKGSVDGDSCEVKDDKILSYNFHGKLDKGVKVIWVFRMNKQDSSWSLDGEWKTTKTKKYYSLTGKSELKEEKDLSRSTLFPHLEELKLADEISFYKEKKKEPLVVSPIPESLKTKSRKKEEPIVAITPENKKNNPSEKMAIVEIKKPELTISKPAVFAKERKSEISQIINFGSDSLELFLYDNGEIDGDTVSVLMNGEIIIAKLCLKASAFKKTIYIPLGSNDSIVLMLYAENLGKYPPNTGLLVIHDGNDSYPVRFTADLQTNAAVLLRRKKQ
jgi:hypothetical protein